MSLYLDLPWPPLSWVWGGNTSLPAHGWPHLILLFYSLFHQQALPLLAHDLHIKEMPSVSHIGGGRFPNLSFPSSYCPSKPSSLHEEYRHQAYHLHPTAAQCPLSAPPRYPGRGHEKAKPPPPRPQSASPLAWGRLCNETRSKNQTPVSPHPESVLPSVSPSGSSPKPLTPFVSPTRIEAP